MKQPASHRSGSANPRERGECRGPRRPAVGCCVSAKTLQRFVAELARLKIRIVDAPSVKTVRRLDEPPSPWLHIGWRELALGVAFVARNHTRDLIFCRIRTEVTKRPHGRPVFAFCRSFSARFAGRPGFSALRLYNDFHKARRERWRKPTR